MTANVLETCCEHPFDWNLMIELSGKMFHAFALATFGLLECGNSHLKQQSECLT